MWETVNKINDMKVIKSKWIYTLKQNDGDIYFI